MASVSQYKHQFFVASVPAVGYKLQVFDAGTATPTAIWKDSALTVSHTNPIILDSNGMPPGEDLYFSATPSDVYDITLLTPADAATGQEWVGHAVPPNTAGTFVPLDGSVAMTGELQLPGDATAGANAVPLDQVTDLIATAVSSLTASIAAASEPVGTIKMWMFGAIPTKYFELDGVDKVRADFPALFALWGTSGGAGNGTTTFGIGPDSRGRVPRGWDSSGLVDLNTPGARTLGSIQEDALQAMTGTCGIDDRAFNFTPTGVFAQSPGSADCGAQGNDSGSILSFDASRVARTAAETRAKNFSCRFIVKALP